MLNGSNVMPVLVYLHFALFWKHSTICDQNEFSGRPLGWSLVRNLVLSFYNKKILCVPEQSLKSYILANSDFDKVCTNW